VNYYRRSNVIHIDGLPVFQQPEDQQAEEEIAAKLSAIWNCQIKSFGMMAAIDWWAERHGMPVGVLELKRRNAPAAAWPNAILNLRKWLALTLASVGMHVPAVFVYKCTDKLFWIPTSEIDANRVIIGGCKTHVKSSNDVEPVIMVPLKSFRELAP